MSERTTLEKRLISFWRNALIVIGECDPDAEAMKAEIAKFNRFLDRFEHRGLPTEREQIEDALQAMSADEACYLARFAVLEIGAKRQRNQVSEEDCEDLLASIGRALQQEQEQLGENPN